jgi:hypothetical protein
MFFSSAGSLACVAEEFGESSGDLLPRSLAKFCCATVTGGSGRTCTQVDILSGCASPLVALECPNGFIGMQDGSGGYISVTCN